MYERRLTHLFALFALLLAVIGAQAFSLQVLGTGAHATKLERRLSRRVTILPRRGEILFRDGTPMAANEPGFGVHVDVEAFDAHRFHCSACGLDTKKRQPAPVRPEQCTRCGSDDGFSLRFLPRKAPLPLDDQLLPVSTPWDCRNCEETTEVALARVEVPRICKWCECVDTVERLPRPTGAELARLLGIDEAFLHTRMRRVRRQRRSRRANGQVRFAHHVLLPRVERSVGLAVTLAGHRYPALVARPVAARSVAPFAKGLVGRVVQPSPEHFPRYTDPRRETRGLHVYRKDEIYQTLFGVQHMERHFDEVLRGVPGKAYRVRTAGTGRELKIDRPVVDGGTIRTTIEPTVQAVAHDLVESADSAAAAVVLDLRDGAIVALASYTAKPDAYHHANIHVAPGSVFKLVTALAFLSSGGDPDETLHCQGRGRFSRWITYKCDGVHPEIDLEHAFERSCNYYFMRRADHAGPEAFADACRRLGLERSPTLPIKGLPSGLERWPEVGHPIPPGELPWMGIGQGKATASPVQIATAYGRMATGGRMIEPYLVIDADRPRTPVPIDPVLAEHAPLLQRAARRVVAGDYGTARRVDELKALSAAGKTGTAEIPRQPGDPGTGRFVNNAWFVGYAPHDAPRYVAVVVHERVTEHGGRMSGKPVATLLRAALALDEVARER